MKAGSEAVRSNGPHRSPRKAGRKRRVAGWSLVTAGVIVAALWVASGWRPLEHFSPKLNVLVDSGALRVLYASNAPWSANYPPSAEPRWLPSFEWWGDDFNGHMHSWGLVHWESLPLSWAMRVILWPIPLLLWTPAALLLRSGILARRRANTNACAKCGYSLAGLAAGAVCPECGDGKGASTT